MPRLLLVLRPISVLAATLGEGLAVPQRTMISGFDIRGIGSVFYLLFALRHGVGGSTADTLVTLTLWNVVASIVAHGIAWRQRARARRGIAPKKP